MVWGYTPRKLQALLFIATKRQERENYEDLVTQFFAAQGDPRDVKRNLQSMARNLS